MDSRVFHVEQGILANHSSKSITTVLIAYIRRKQIDPKSIALQFPERDKCSKLY